GAGRAAGRGTARDDARPRAPARPLHRALGSRVSASDAQRQRRAFLQIHACVLLWGFTAILGQPIPPPALPLVWWRMGLVVLALACVPRVWRGLRALPARLLLAYAGIGALVALHWLTFYGAIKLANASVGATCMALATVFIALTEPRLVGR